MQDNLLSGWVESPTRDNALLDLLITNLMANVKLRDNLDNSDHRVIIFAKNYRKMRHEGRRRTLHLKRTSFSKLCSILQNGINFFNHFHTRHVCTFLPKPIFSFQRCRTLNDNCAVMLHCMNEWMTCIAQLMRTESPLGAFSSQSLIGWCGHFTP